MKNARIKKGLSQSDLAKKVGCSRSYICMLENMKDYNFNISVKLLISLSKELDICPVTFFIYLLKNDFFSNCKRKSSK